MNVTVERVENEATLKITAPAAEVNAGYKKAVQKIADQANIPGFRKGKAPRKIVESNVGMDALLQEAFDLIAPKAFSDALDETQTKTHRILRVQKEDVSFLREKMQTWRC